MTTPSGIPAAVIQRRRALGLDRYDEIWEGEYRVVPTPRLEHGFVVLELARLLGSHAKAAGLFSVDTFNLGRQADYRVPDLGFLVGSPHGVYVETAAVVVEVLSPGDDTFRKFPFYAAHGVEEIIVADPDEREVRLFALDGRQYVEVTSSKRLGVSAEEIRTGVEWP